MGILIAAVVSVVAAGTVLAFAMCKLGRGNIQPAGVLPQGRQPGRYLGASCSCGGQLQWMWQHGRGQVLGCSRYPDCNKAYQHNGRPLPPVAGRILQQVP